MSSLRKDPLFSINLIRDYQLVLKKLLIVFVVDIAIAIQ